jgi:hypothetical protein
VSQRQAAMAKHAWMLRSFLKDNRAWE